MLNRYQYTGQQFDAITQQYYLRARFYNPAIARFTQEDEYHGDGLNLYAYCANNPVDYYDLSGYCASETKESPVAKISDVDESKLSGWVERPNNEIYNKYKETFDNSTFYNQKNGKVIWPENDGAVFGTTKSVTLTKGYQIDRFGKETGYYVSPKDMSYESRYLRPRTKELTPYTQYEVLKPIKAEGSVIAPWFNQPGGGIQFKLEKSIRELIEENKIRRID
ncbi:glycohydrolase toxin TNT-related protein [Selenomonas ruminantium]|uniref:glycohydrolase toxin TNT-related protein n=1 Tax=Selenomonas ruminantium TaxID=971 RepID=UPI00210A3416|nr:glycohydrolase toxin TNT-related protein [Selenomonas ruminantium]